MLYILACMIRVNICKVKNLEKCRNNLILVLLFLSTFIAL